MESRQKTNSVNFGLFLNGKIALDQKLFDKDFVKDSFWLKQKKNTDFDFWRQWYLN